VLTLPRSLLPAHAYWSSAWFAREQDRLFRRCWNLVCALDDLDDRAGLMATVGGTPLWIEQDSGHVTVTGDGEPTVGVWAGYVFAHLYPALAPSLDAWLGDMPSRIGPFHPEQLVEVARHRFELAANWKLFIENHVDVYHLGYLHRESLRDYDHRRAEWSTCGPHWAFYEPPRRGVDLHDERFWRGLRPIAGVGEEHWGSGAHLIFPSLTLATGAGFFMTSQCIPIGPEQSVVDLRIRAERDADATEVLRTSRMIIEDEDGAACEALQEAVRSPSFSVGPLARHHDLPITHFHQSVLAAMDQ
jgi:phenylpropionate dioxygenase-like ring-hydroxylating dioxygenase large terminal subunit